MFDSILTAGGKLIDSVIGHNSSKQDRKWNNKYWKNQLQYRVADAKKAGIHPLAAIGAPMMGSPNTQTIGTDIGDAAATMERGLRKRDDRKAQSAVFEQQKAESNARIADTLNQIKNRDRRTDLLEKQAMDSAAATSNTGNDKVDGQYRVITLPDGRTLRVKGTSAQDYADEFGDVLSELYGWSQAGRAWWDQVKRDYKNKRGRLQKPAEDYFKFKGGSSSSSGNYRGN